MIGSRTMMALAFGLLASSAALAQKPTDPNRALVLEVKGEVTAKAAGGTLAPVAKGAELARGQELATGVDSEAKLAFADGSVMVVAEMSQLLLADLLSSGKRQAVLVQLKMGEMAAQVNPKQAFKTDFKVTTPTGTASVRGTEIRQISYHPARGTEVKLASGSLLVEGNDGSKSSMTGGDDAALNTDGTITTPVSSTQADSRLNVAPPVTSSESTANNFNIQPVGFTPGAAADDAGTEGLEDVQSGGTSSFLFVFQRQ